jgi:hypothetical protein
MYTHTHTHAHAHTHKRTHDPQLKKAPPIVTAPLEVLGLRSPRDLPPPGEALCSDHPNTYNGYGHAATRNSNRNPLTRGCAIPEAFDDREQGAQGAVQDRAENRSFFERICDTLTPPPQPEEAGGGGADWVSRIHRVSGLGGGGASVKSGVMEQQPPPEHILHSHHLPHSRPPTASRSGTPSEVEAATMTETETGAQIET